MDISFTDRELDVMAVLWHRGSGTVAEVREGLDDDLAYTTVLTILRTLEEKGFVTHLAEGKAHRYLPAVSQDLAGKSALARLIDKVFAGSSEMLLTQLVSERNLDTHELRRLRKLLDERLAQQHGSSRKRRS
ncbi:MAG TPA: BlaI/MecI/CopY family transcriptional regulator [Gemmatimonadaceae bacterium]|nr:BlaI/MecI/CopY family transcriptional regulator [Gemmatimonadaceae bacterium]